MKYCALWNERLCRECNDECEMIAVGKSIPHEKGEYTHRFTSWRRLASWSACRTTKLHVISTSAHCIGCSTPQSGHKGLSRALRSLIILEQGKTHLSRALRSLMTSRTTRCAVYSVCYVRRSHLYSITATRVKIIKRSGKPRVQLPSEAELKEFRMA